MAFVKEGSPQRLNVMTNTCEVCRQRTASCVENGKMVCNDCRSKETSQIVE